MESTHHSFSFCLTWPGWNPTSSSYPLHLHGRWDLVRPK